ncbi:GspJ family type II secretion system protein [Acidobacteria bacterium AH-259-A15]|nr:GspJ family type II secretion system protein [Acidobacteria bacterium AH-259-A15]
MSAVSCQLSAAGGFSLLELIIAFTILGLMAGVIFSSFRLALNSYEKGQERLETEARKRVLEDQIKRQIGSLYPVRPSGSFLESQEVDAQAQQPAAILSQVPLFYGTPDSVTFVTVAPLMLQENPGLTIVRYGLAQDEWGNHYLGGMETRYMGLDSFTFMVNAPRGKPLALVESVENLEFQYYGYDSQSQSYQWLNSWIGDEMRSVPEAIRIDYDENHLLVSINASFYGTRLTGGLQRFIRR